MGENEIVIANAKEKTKKRPCGMCCSLMGVFIFMMIFSLGISFSLSFVFLYLNSQTSLTAKKEKRNFLVTQSVSMQNSVRNSIKNSVFTMNSMSRCILESYLLWKDENDEYEMRKMIKMLFVMARSLEKVVLKVNGTLSIGWYFYDGENKRMIDVYYDKNTLVIGEGNFSTIYNDTIYKVVENDLPDETNFSAPMYFKIEGEIIYEYESEEQIAYYMETNVGSYDYYVDDILTETESAIATPYFSVSKSGTLGSKDYSDPHLKNITWVSNEWCGMRLVDYSSFLQSIFKTSGLSSSDSNSISWIFELNYGYLLGISKIFDENNPNNDLTYSTNTSVEFYMASSYPKSSIISSISKLIENNWDGVLEILKSSVGEVISRQYNGLEVEIILIEEELSPQINGTWIFVVCESLVSEYSLIVVSTVVSFLILFFCLLFVLVLWGIFSYFMVIKSRAIKREIKRIQNMQLDSSKLRNKRNNNKSFKNKIVDLNNKNLSTTNIDDSDSSATSSSLSNNSKNKISLLEKLICFECNFDGKDGLGGPNFYEIQYLIDSLKMMKKKLREFRSFLPPSVLKSVNNAQNNNIQNNINNEVSKFENSTTNSNSNSNGQNELIKRHDSTDSFGSLKSFESSHVTTIGNGNHELECSILNNKNKFSLYVGAKDLIVLKATFNLRFKVKNENNLLENDNLQSENGSEVDENEEENVDDNLNNFSEFYKSLFDSFGSFKDSVLVYFNHCEIVWLFEHVNPLNLITKIHQILDVHPFTPKKSSTNVNLIQGNQKWNPWDSLRMFLSIGTVIFGNIGSTDLKSFIASGPGLDNIDDIVRRCLPFIRISCCESFFKMFSGSIEMRKVLNGIYEVGRIIGDDFKDNNMLSTFHSYTRSLCLFEENKFYDAHTSMLFHIHKNPTDDLALYWLDVFNKKINSLKKQKKKEDINEKVNNYDEIVVVDEKNAKNIKIENEENKNKISLPLLNLNKVLVNKLVSDDIDNNNSQQKANQLKVSEDNQDNISEKFAELKLDDQKKL